MKQQMTEQIARAIATDTANRNVKKQGRLVWSEEDYNLAVAKFNQLWSESVKWEN
jgi:hypothetical protein